MHKLAFLLLALVLPLKIWAAGPLEPLKTDNPRNTMQSYMDAMKDYKKGLQTGDRRLKARLDDAVRCLNLENVPLLNRMQVGREAAILLKEVIDRMIVIDYEKIPIAGEAPDKPLTQWRLDDTEITIAKVDKGERAGEYLFSTDTTSRAKEFYEKVNYLPYLKGTTGGAGYRPPWLERNMPPWATNSFLSLAYWQWLGIVAAILVGIVMRMVITGLAKIADRLLNKNPSETGTHLIKIMAPPTALLATTAIWFAALYLLQLEGAVLHIINVGLQIVLFIALTWFFYRAVTLISPQIQKVVNLTHNKIDDQLYLLIDRGLKAIVIMLGVLLGLNNLGVQVFSLLAGLGIGGLAVALGAKDTLANFFGSLMIMFDRPFQIGHTISVKGVDGTVEDIGFRSTKLRSPQNTVISIPNSEIAIAQVENFTLRKYRRVQTILGTSYNTPPEKIEAFIDGIQKIIFDNAYSKKDKDSVQVVLHEFVENRMTILINFFLSVQDYTSEQIERQKIFLEIIRLARNLEIKLSPN